MEIPNSNLEIRNNLQIQNSNDQNIPSFAFCISDFGHSNLFRISDFEFRILKLSR